MKLLDWLTGRNERYIPPPLNLPPLCARTPEGEELQAALNTANSELREVCLSGTATDAEYEAAKKRAKKARSNRDSYWREQADAAGPERGIAG